MAFKSVQMYEGSRSTDFPICPQRIRDLRSDAPPSEVTVYNIDGEFLRTEPATFWGQSMRTDMRRGKRNNHQGAI